MFYKIMKRIKHIIEYLFVIILIPFLIIIPYNIRIKIGRHLGLALYYAYKKRRDIAFENIFKSFPGMSKKWHTSICKKSFKHFGIIAMEFIQLFRFSNKFIRKHILIEGEEHIKEALARGRGIIGLCPHLGNWEFVAACIALKGYPVSVIMKKQSNPFINQIIEKLRSSFNVECIYKSKAGFPVIRALKRNRIVAFVADQDAGKNGLFLKFLGRSASTAQGPARYAISNNSPALIFTGIKEGNTFKIFISQSLNFDYNKNNLKSAVTNNTSVWTKKIEEYIKKYPEQYFWMHRRWKSKEK